MRRRGSSMEDSSSCSHQPIPETTCSYFCLHLWEGRADNLYPKLPPVPALIAFLLLFHLVFIAFIFAILKYFQVFMAPILWAKQKGKTNHHYIINGLGPKNSHTPPSPNISIIQCILFMHYN